MMGAAWEDLSFTALLTLGHFVWQGAALGLLALAGVWLLRRDSARLRYGFLCVVLGAMAVCPVVTLAWVLQEARPPAPTAQAQEVWAPVEHQAAYGLDGVEGLHGLQGLQGLDGQIEQAEVEDLTQLGQWSEVEDAVIPDESIPSISSILSMAPEPPAILETSGPPWAHYAPQLVLCYALGVLLMWLRLLAALYGGQRLRRRAYGLEDRALLDALARQVRLLGLRATPAIAFCERVAVPTLVGVLRPMVLLPVTVHTGLSPAQLELLLCHELAHIRRYDHLVNLLQSVVEAFLFFHPAVLWVSHRMRIERELCCDDLVLAQGGESLSYADALLRMAETSTGVQRHALLLSAAGHRGQLTRRIHRILEVPAPHLRLTRGGLAALILTGALGIIAIVQVAALQANPESPEEPVAVGDPSLERSLEELFAEPDTPEEPQPEPPSAPPAETSATPTASQPLSSGAAAVGELEAALNTLDNEPDWWLRKLAVQKLSEIGGEPAIFTLIDVLRGLSSPHRQQMETQAIENEFAVRAAAAEGLGALKAEEALPHLAAALQHPALHEPAGAALAQFPPEKVMPYLRAALEEEGPLREGALRALAHVGTPEAAEFLVDTHLARGHYPGDIRAWLEPAAEPVRIALGNRLLQSDDPFRQLGGLSLLAHAEGALPREAMQRLLKHEDVKIRAAAIDMLQAANIPEVEATLIQVLTQDPVHVLRGRAARGLQERGWQPASPEEEAAYQVALENFSVAATLGSATVEPLKVAMLAEPGNSNMRHMAVSAFAQAAMPSDAPALTPLLNSESQQVRMAAIEAIERLKHPDSALLLLPALKDTESQVRHRAVQALGALGDARALPALIAAIRDLEVGEEAVNALGRLDAPQAREALLAVVEDPGFTPSTRYRAAIALAKTKDATIASRLEEIAASIGPEVRTNSRNRVFRGEGQLDSLHAHVLGSAQAIKQELAQEREEAEAERAAGPEASPVSDPTDPSDPTDQLEAGETPGDVPPPADEAVSTDTAPQTPDQPSALDLAAQLKDPDEWLRKVAAQQLGEMITPRDPAVPLPAVRSPVISGLIAALKDEAEPVQIAAAEALGKIRAAEAINHLVAALRTDSEALRQAVAQALAGFGFEQVREMILVAARDNEWAARRGAVDALARFQEPEAVQALLALMHHPVTTVPDPDGEGQRTRQESYLPQVKQTLAKMPRELVQPLLIQALRSDSLDSAAGAAETLAEMGGEEARQALLAAAQSDAVLGRYAAARALGAFTDDETTAVLRGLLSAPDHHLRTQAALALEARNFRPESEEEHARYQIALHNYSQVLGDHAIEPLLLAVAAPPTKELLPSWQRGRSNIAAEAIQSLGTLRSDAAVDALGGLLSAEDAARRAVLASALGATGNPRAVPLLLPLLQDPVGEVRQTALQSLKTLGAQAPEIAAATEDPHPEVRAAAAAALGAAPLEETAPALLRLLEDPQREVVYAALEVLGIRISNRMNTRELAQQMALFSTSLGRWLDALGPARRSEARRVLRQLLLREDISMNHKPYLARSILDNLGVDAAPVLQPWIVRDRLNVPRLSTNVENALNKLLEAQQAPPGTAQEELGPKPSDGSETLLE